MIAVQLTAVDYHSVTGAITGFAAGWTHFDVQYSTRPDFRFALAPMVVNVAIAGGGAFTIAGLNQRTTYFMRFRERNGTDVGDWTDPIAVYTPTHADPVIVYAGANKAPAFVVVPEYVTAWASDAAVAGYPASNLGTDGPNDQWWSDYSGNGYAFEMAVGGAPVDTIALLETNAHADMTITIKAGPDATNVRSGAPAFSTGPLPFHASVNLGGRPGYHALVGLGAPKAFRYWRIEVGGHAPLDRFVATYAVIGLARSAGKNMADESDETPIDLGTLERTREGNPDRKDGFRRGRKVEFDIAMMTETAWETQFADLRNIIGSNDPVLVVPNSKAGAFLHDRILFGPVQLRTAHPHSKRFTTTLTVSSQI